MEDTRHINDLIEIVSRGGTIMTGVDIYNENRVLIIKHNVLINSLPSLLKAKKNGLDHIPINTDRNGGMWDREGRPIKLATDAPSNKKKKQISSIEKKLREIKALKREASLKHQKAKKNIQNVFTEIKQSGGEFDCSLLHETLSDVLGFLTANETGFSYITKEVYSFDDYLLNHSINVCTIGAAVIKHFNTHFSNVINTHLNTTAMDFLVKPLKKDSLKSYICYLPEDIYQITMGYFLHDVGKVLLPLEILQKKGPLTPEEFNIIQTHAIEKGLGILEKNHLNETSIQNIVQYHHACLYEGEEGCYPKRRPIEIHPYVKVCKLADMYDAMTSKRSYHEALNPIGVVTDLFHKYAEKDPILQFVLHAFVKVVGIYPTGSIVWLINRQKAFVLDSRGPIIVPFTDAQGNSIEGTIVPIDLSHEDKNTSHVLIDRSKALVSPIEVYDVLPAFLKSDTPI